MGVSGLFGRCCSGNTGWSTFPCKRGGQKCLYGRQGVNFGFPSVFLSQTSCGDAEMTSELVLSLAQCFISLSPP